MNYDKNEHGFTLIELLMVISIITLLSSMFFSYVGSAKAKSRDSIRLSDMKQIGTAANLYYEDKGILPESIGVLVSNNYLSAVPSDPKTGELYSFQPVGSGYVISASYETQFLENGDPQKVGVIIGNVDISTLCASSSATTTDDLTYPNCNNGDSNDQIIGVTGGHRRGGGGTSIRNDVSSCSFADISKICPPEPYMNNCYCENTIKNIDNLSQEKCKNEYGLYWDGSSCFDQFVCEDVFRVWSNGVCNPKEIVYPVCSIQRIDEVCPFPPPPAPVPPIFTNCYCNGTLNNINPDTLSQIECKSEYGLYWDVYITGSEKCFSQTTCEVNNRIWSGGICNPPQLPI